MSDQNFSNHGRIVPAFHFVLLPILALNLIFSAIITYKLIASAEISLLFRISGLFLLLVAVALLVMAVLARLFALGVQDRVIRLEERLRCERLLPPDLQSRISEFTVNQLVGLRFASDAELPALARKVLDEKLNDRKSIKQLVQNWRPDYQRI
jgi:hypothetical protein